MDKGEKISLYNLISFLFFRLYTTQSEKDFLFFISDLPKKFVLKIQQYLFSFSIFSDNNFVLA